MPSDRDGTPLAPHTMRKPLTAGGERRRRTLRRQGIEAATRLVAKAASDDAARLFERLVDLCDRGSERQSFKAADVLMALGPDLKDDEVSRRMRRANNRFDGAFGFDLIVEAATKRWEMKEGAAGLEGAVAPSLTTTRTFLDLVEHGPAMAPVTDAELDEASLRWVPIVTSATLSGRGHHLALRVAPDDPRAAADFAGQIAATGIGVVLWNEGERLARVLLKSELFGRGVVVVASSLLAEPPPVDDDAESWRPDLAEAVHAVALITDGSPILPWFDGLANTYVWRVPSRGALPRSVKRLIGGVIGPIGYAEGWRAARVKAVAPGIGAAGTRALLGEAEDARDVDSMAALAVAMAGIPLPGFTNVDAASQFVAASFSASTPAPVQRPGEDDSFDRRLIACDADGRALLNRADGLAGGGRVLVWGPPGGGKSSYARALAASIGAGTDGGARPFLRVEPSMLLARGWGASERLIESLWSRASRQSATLIADEFDSLGVVREADAPASGNAYLIRCLTNEILRQFDRHPEVAFIATVNDRAILDPAISRRFSIQIEVKDELAPGQEHIAWRSMLGMEPPPDWVPVRASISDFAAARERCRLIGRTDARALAAAIKTARSARLARRPRSAAGLRKTQLH